MSKKPAATKPKAATPAKTVVRPEKPAPPAVVKPPKGGIKVTALDVNGSNTAGYYGHVRRRVGDVFVVTDLIDSKKGTVLQTARQIVDKSSWMQEVDPTTPEKVTTIEDIQQRVKKMGKAGLDPDPIGARAADEAGDPANAGE
jgi:hypothetical protein